MIIVPQRTDGPTLLDLINQTYYLQVIPAVIINLNAALGTKTNTIEEHAVNKDHCVRQFKRQN